MVASRTSVQQATDILLKHVDEQTLLTVFRELRQVQGNASFRETIKQMHAQLCAELAKKKNNVAVL